MQEQWVERMRFLTVGCPLLGLSWAVLAVGNLDDPIGFWLNVTLAVSWLGIGAHAVAYEAPSVVTASEDGIRIQRGRLRDRRLRWDEVIDIRSDHRVYRSPIIVEAVAEPKPIRTGLYGPRHRELLALWRSRSTSQDGSS